MPVRAYVADNVILDKDLTGFTISGDPGCDGYNVESVAVFEEIVGQRADFHLVLGDLVPAGHERWFRQFEDILDRAASAPVFCLAGNHDLPGYAGRLGRENYFIRAGDTLTVVLDNSRREFGKAAVDLLREALDSQSGGVEHIFVAFHVPPPNGISKNSISRAEWDKVSDLLIPHRARVRAIFAGHVHSAFSFELDSLPVVVTGGGGARLDPVDNGYFDRNRHHYMLASREGGSWRLAAKAVFPGGAPATEAWAAEVAAALAESFSGECRAHERYRAYAERALLLGQPGLAKLFRAAADSERHHAANMLLALGEIGDNARNLADSIRREEDEWRREYVRHLEAARRLKADGRAATAFDCAMRAEKVHHAMLTAALASLEQGGMVPERRYFTCTRCGFTHEGNAPPPVCPACGTDDKRFAEVE